MNLDKFTAAQKLAIISDRKNIFVSASAGSGKTTVMIQRILRLLEAGVSLENMVICTFTNAASADTREKLFANLRENLSSEWAKNALISLTMCSISTINSFCVDLCRDYFYFLSIDPLFEIIDERKARALLTECIKNEINKRLVEGDKEFSEFVELFSPSRSDNNLIEIVLRVYDFISIQRLPEEFKKTIKERVLIDELNLAEIKGLIEGGRKAQKFLNDETVNSAETLSHILFILSVVENAESEYSKKKLNLSCLDFNDVERNVLRLLEDDEIKEEINKKYRFLFVDEYQDINPLQDAIFSCFSADKFFVGDIKQSIYRFRLSDPEIFARHFEKAKKNKSQYEAITLDRNFRSDYRILSFCDRVFSNTLTKDFGGTQYLNAAPDGKVEKFAKPVVVDFIVLEKKNTSTKPMGIYSVKDSSRKESKNERRALENNQIVSHIEMLLVNEAVNEEDIVILTRSLKKEAISLRDAILKKGIPVTICLEKSFLENSKILAFVNYLSLLCNQNDDISLASVLKTNIGGNLTEDCLIKIRKESCSELPFYKAAFSYITTGTDKKIVDKIVRLRANLEEDLLLSAAIPVSELAGRISSKFNYFSTFNTKVQEDEFSFFLDAFCSFDKSVSLKNAVSRIKKGALGGFETASTSSVRIMTIHSSKGLEFPFVILPFLDKAFNTQEKRESCIIDSNLGIGLKYFCKEKRKIFRTPLFNLIAMTSDRKNIEEELRLLYVAITRAIRQVALFASIDNIEKYNEAIKPEDAKRMLDWVFGKTVKQNLIYKQDQPSKALASTAKKEIVGEKIKPKLKANKSRKPLKLSVSKIIERETDIFVNSLVERQELSSSGDGIAYHKFMEVYNYSESFLFNMEKFKKDFPAFYKLLEEEKVKKAIGIIENKIKDKEYYRELGFIYKDEKGTLIQGVVDLIILNGNNSFEIIDYKTGSLTEERLKGYKKQMDIYAKIARDILKRKVSSKAIYSFANSDLRSI